MNEDSFTAGRGNMLYELIKQRRGSGVSGPRDMLYAHLSLTDIETQADVSVRYDLSVADVY
jgi:hypothetical protein